MPMPPFSHHEILALAEPFVRAGFSPDMAASRRLERSLSFRQRAPQAAPETADRETRLEAAQRHGNPASAALELVNPDPGHYRLTRRLRTLEGLEARLETEGSDVAALLAALLAVTAERALRATPHGVIALSWQVACEGRGQGRSADPLRLLGSEALCHGLRLRLLLPPPGPGGVNADLELDCGDGPRPQLPDDLFAVLGRRWGRLREIPQGWRGTLQLPRRDPARSRQAELDFLRLASHLATTLAASPAAFHARHRAARWLVYARRSVPLACCAGLLAITAAVPRLDLAETSVLRMLIFNSPPLLLIAFFCLREVPRIEIPPRPRPGASSGWSADIARLGQ